MDPIQFTSCVFQENGSWLFEWDAVGGATEYRIILEGNEIDSVEDPEYTFTGPMRPGWAGDYPPPLEVMVDDNLAPSEINKPFLLVQWYQEDGADAEYYSFDEYLSGSWSNRIIQDENGSWVYSIQTPTLADETLFIYRVIGYGSIQQPTDAQGYRIFVVRPPTFADTSIEVSYDDDLEEIVISEAE